MADSDVQKIYEALGLDYAKRADRVSAINAEWQGWIKRPSDKTVDEDWLDACVIRLAQAVVKDAHWLRGFSMHEMALAGAFSQRLKNVIFPYAIERPGATEWKTLRPREGLSTITPFNFGNDIRSFSKDEFLEISGASWVTCRELAAVRTLCGDLTWTPKVFPGTIRAIKASLEKLLKKSKKFELPEEIQKQIAAAYGNNQSARTIVQELAEQGIHTNYQTVLNIVEARGVPIRGKNERKKANPGPKPE